MKAVVYQEPYKVTVKRYNRHPRALIVAGRAAPGRIVSH